MSLIVSSAMFGFWSGVIFVQLCQGKIPGSPQWAVAVLFAIISVGLYLSFIRGDNSKRSRKRMSDPTDEELAAAIKAVWVKTNPSREAQGIRSSISVSFDDARWPQWMADYIPEYVWDLVDIAAQRGINSKRD